MGGGGAGLSPNTGSYGYAYMHELSKICKHEHGEVGYSAYNFIRLVCFDLKILMYI